MLPETVTVVAAAAVIGVTITAVCAVVLASVVVILMLSTPATVKAPVLVKPSAALYARFTLSEVPVSTFSAMLLTADDSAF